MYIKFAFINQKGLSLVELLLVVGVLTILISGLVVLINPLQRIGQANDAKRKTELDQIKKALEIYYYDNGRYPNSSGTYSIEGTNWGGTWSTYMPKLPKDPTDGQTYVYFTPNSGACSNGQCFYLYTSLQLGGADPQSCFPGTADACTNAEANGLANSCGGVCNYGVSSPNVTP